MPVQRVRLFQCSLIRSDAAAAAGHKTTQRRRRPPVRPRTALNADNFKTLKVKANYSTC